MAPRCCNSALSVVKPVASIICIPISRPVFDVVTTGIAIRVVLSVVERKFSA